VAYGLIAFWYVVPRLSRLAREDALVLLVLVHVFRVAGGVILAPGSVDAAIPAEFRTMVGYGDMLTGVLALVAAVALRTRFAGAIALTWVFIVVGMIDTVNAIVQSLRFNVFVYPLGVNWMIVTVYVPALLVSAVLVIVQLLAPSRSRGRA
jgi:hypothetical protein